MPTYMVTWDYMVTSDSPRKAAEEAFKAVQEPGAKCTIFTVDEYVEDEVVREGVMVDLSAPEDEEPYEEET